MQISIYYQEEDQYLLDKVKKLARRERRSKSSAILSILEKYFESERKLGEILRDMKAIDMKKLHDALEIQRKNRSEKKIGEIMLKEGFVDEGQLTRALEVQHSLNNGGTRRSPSKNS